MQQYYSQIVETDTLSLEFSRKLSIFTLRTVVLSQICPSPSAMLSHCNTQSTLGKGKRHTSVSRFLTSILVHSHGPITCTLETARIDEQLLRVVSLSKRVITVEFVYYLRMRKKLFTCKSSEVSDFPLDSLNLLSLFCYR